MYVMCQRVLNSTHCTNVLAREKNKCPGHVLDYRGMYMIIILQENRSLEVNT